MYSVNEAHFLDITPLFHPSACFADNNCASVLGATGFASGPGLPLTRMNASLRSHKLDFNILVLYLMSLLALHVPLDSPFLSTQFFALNLDC